MTKREFRLELVARHDVTKRELRHVPVAWHEKAKRERAKTDVEWQDVLDRPIRHARMRREGEACERFLAADQRDRPVRHVVIRAGRITPTRQQQRLIIQNTQRRAVCFLDVSLFFDPAHIDGTHIAQHFAGDLGNAERLVASAHKDHGPT